MLARNFKSVPTCPVFSAGRCPDRVLVEKINIPILARADDGLKNQVHKTTTDAGQYNNGPIVCSNEIMLSLPCTVVNAGSVAFSRSGNISLNECCPRKGAEATFRNSAIVSEKIEGSSLCSVIKDAVVVDDDDDDDDDFNAVFLDFEQSTAKSVSMPILSATPNMVKGLVKQIYGGNALVEKQLVLPTVLQHTSCTEKETVLLPDYGHICSLVPPNVIDTKIKYTDRFIGGSSSLMCQVSSEKINSIQEDEDDEVFRKCSMKKQVRKVAVLGEESPITHNHGSTLQICIESSPSPIIHNGTRPKNIQVLPQMKQPPQISSEPSQESAPRLRLKSKGDIGNASRVFSKPVPSYKTVSTRTLNVQKKSLPSLKLQSDSKMAHLGPIQFSVDDDDFVDCRNTVYKKKHKLSTESSLVIVKQSKKQKLHQGFVMDKADVSDDEDGSTDEEEEGDDEFDFNDSFIDDGTQPSRTSLGSDPRLSSGNSHNRLKKKKRGNDRDSLVDRESMMNIYQQSLRSPELNPYFSTAAVKGNRFKMVFNCTTPPRGPSDDENDDDDDGNVMSPRGRKDKMLANLPTPELPALPSRLSLGAPLHLIELDDNADGDVVEVDEENEGTEEDSVVGDDSEGD